MFPALNVEILSPANIATVYRPPDKQQARSIDSRQSTLLRYTSDYISTRRSVLPVGEYSISTSRRGTMIIRKRMTYFAFYADAAIPRRTYPATPVSLQTIVQTLAGTSFAIFLKAHSDGLWLTRSHFRKPVLFRSRSLVDFFARRKDRFLHDSFLQITAPRVEDGTYLTITITITV